MKIPPKKGGIAIDVRVLACVLVAALMMCASGCAAISPLGAANEAPGRPAPLAPLPAPARITVEKLTGAGEIRSLKQVESDRGLVYHLEGRVDGKEVQYDVAGDGAVLQARERIAYDSLPPAVQAAVRDYFNSAVGLTVSKEVQSGKTFYEVQCSKGKAAVTLKLTDTGRIMEKEKS